MDKLLTDERGSSFIKKPPVTEPLPFVSFDRPEHQTFYGSLKAEVRGREGICCSSRSAAGIYLYISV